MLLEYNEKLLAEAESLRKSKQNTNNDEDDDEFMVADESDHNNELAIQHALGTIKIDENESVNFNDHVPAQIVSSITSSQNDSFQFGALPSIDEPLVMEEKSNKSLIDAKKALSEIVDVYANGMGDQEVLMLNVEGEQNVKDLHAKIHLDKSLGVINEEEEEEEDADENEKGDGKDDAILNNETRKSANSDENGKSDSIREVDLVAHKPTLNVLETEWDEVSKVGGGNYNNETRVADTSMTYKGDNFH